MTESEGAEARLEEFHELTARLKAQLGRVVVGQDDAIDGVLTCLFAESHVLLEGVPGLGKTLLVRSLAESLGLPFARIQFTPDLMPADILGTTSIVEVPGGTHRFEFKRGPLFSSVVLADEINRATPKTQSALLEAMAEHKITLAGVNYDLGRPYFVLATQNPLEMEGTYPLPEAQLDRFLLKVIVPFPTEAELHQILDRTTAQRPVGLETTWSKEEVLRLQETVRMVPVPKYVQTYAVRLLRATHPSLEGSSALVRQFVRTGASPRGAQALILAAKVQALFDKRALPNLDDVRKVALPALRHRLLLNFEGEAEGLSTDEVLTDLLRELSVDDS